MAETEKLLRMADVMQICGASRSTIYRLVARGELPEPVKLGHGLRWRSGELVAALDALSSRSREAA